MNSSAGFLGWAKFMSTMQPMAERAPEKMTISVKLSDCIQVPSGTLMHILKPRLNTDLLTRADSRWGSQSLPFETTNQFGN